MAASPQFPLLPPDWFETTESLNHGRLFVRLLQKKNLQVPAQRPNRPPRFLFIVHGQAEQQDRYEHFPFYLSDAIDAIGLVDLPGHGQSAGIRGHVQSFDQYSDSVLQAFQFCFHKVRQTWPQAEAFWLGHSLGGLITLRTLLKKQDLPLKGVIVSAPLLGLAFTPPLIKKYFALLLEPLLGRLPLNNELDAKGLSHDEAVVHHYAANPRNHNKVTPRFFVRMMREIELLKAPPSEFAYNLLMISPLADPIVSWKACRQFFDRLKMKEKVPKEYQSFPNFFHESFNEPDKERAFICLETWINKIN